MTDVRHDKTEPATATPMTTAEPDTRPNLRGLRIGYLIPEFPGQTHTFFWREISAIREAGAQVRLFSTRPPADACPHAFATEAARLTRYLARLAPPDLLLLLSRPHHSLRTLRYLASLSHKSLRRLLKLFALLLAAARFTRLARKDDIQHLHVHSCADSAHIAALARLLGGPAYSLTLHGDLLVYGADHPQKMARAAFVSAVTRPLQQQIIRVAHLPADRAPVIWQGVDTDRFTPAPVPPPVDPHFTLLTIARIEHNKGHRFALEALRNAIDAGHNLHYRIAGSGPHVDDLQRHIARFRLEPHVTILGPISEDRVIQELRQAHAFVLPSVREGEAAPVSVMEAMSCGLPVVCSIIGGTPEMITHGRDGLLVEQKDVDGLAEAMIELAADPHRRRALGRAARRTAIERFDYRIVAARLAERIARAVAEQA